MDFQGNDHLHHYNMATIRSLPFVSTQYLDSSHGTMHVWTFCVFRSHLHSPLWSGLLKADSKSRYDTYSRALRLARSSIAQCRLLHRALGASQFAEPLLRGVKQTVLLAHPIQAVSQYA